jgi:hypothetical protein
MNSGGLSLFGKMDCNVEIWRRLCKTGKGLRQDAFVEFKKIMEMNLSLPGLIVV